MRRAGTAAAAVAAVAAAVAAGACGGRAAPGGPRGAGAPPEVDLVLYRDGALVRTRHRVAVDGRARFAVALPGDVEAGALEARVVEGGATLGALTVREPRLRAGDVVEVRDGDRVVAGTLRWYDGARAVIETADGPRLLLDPRHVVRRDGGGATRQVDVELTGGGAATVELVYVTRRLRWTADYTLVMDRDGDRAELHGALGIDGDPGAAFERATITLIDAPRPTRIVAFDRGPAGEAPGATPARPAVADPTKPRAEQPAPRSDAAARAPATPRARLPYPVRVAPGAQAVSLLAGSVHLRARQTLVYDPVGDDLNQSTATPNQVTDYGLSRRSTAVSQSIDVDLAAARVPAGLPTGTVRLLERGPDGALSPLGEAKIFERAGSDTDQLAPTATIAVGRAAGISGRRIRRELTIDRDARRLIEEFAIELTSTSERAREVIVREHLYRGLTWRLAYHSAPVVKEGPQKIAMRATVPPRGKATVVYRVVYHW